MRRAVRRWPPGTTCAKRRASQRASCHGQWAPDDVKTIIEGCSEIVASDHLQDWQRAMALNNRGSALLGSGDLSAAEDNYTRALALDPHYSMAYYNRGTLRQRAGNLIGAVDDFTQDLILDADYFEAYHNRGVAYEKIGRYNKAIFDFTAALVRKPDLYSALNNVVSLTERADPLAVLWKTSTRR